jgi:hypothetical protein
MMCDGTNEIIKDAPIEISGNNLLITPILNYIKYLGKPI